MNELELIKKCQQNDYSAQLDVYNNYKDMMYNVSYRIVRNRQDAEDILQESFIKGFQKMHQVKEQMGLGGWLKRIVVNSSLDHVRRQKNEYWLEETRIIEKESDEVVELESSEQISIPMIKECINNLKDKYRIILVLYMIEDYNHREISEMLELKESTVRNQYRRGKNLLIAEIQKARKEWI